MALGGAFWSATLFTYRGISVLGTIHAKQLKLNDPEAPNILRLWIFHNFVCMEPLGDILGNTKGVT